MSGWRPLRIIRLMFWVWSDDKHLLQFGKCITLHFFKLQQRCDFVEIRLITDVKWYIALMCLVYQLPHATKYCCNAKEFVFVQFYRTGDGLLLQATIKQLSVRRTLAISPLFRVQKALVGRLQEIAKIQERYMDYKRSYKNIHMEINSVQKRITFS